MEYSCSDNRTTVWVIYKTSSLEEMRNRIASWNWFSFGSEY